MGNWFPYLALFVCPDIKAGDNPRLHGFLCIRASTGIEIKAGVLIYAPPYF
jgi:hypothetical protein